MSEIREESGDNCDTTCLLAHCVFKKRLFQIIFAPIELQNLEFCIM